MKYLTSSTTAISLIVAVVLFGVASWFDASRPAPEPYEPDVTPQMIREVRPDSQVRDDRVTQSCRDAEAGLLRTVDAAQSCEVDDDCVLLDYGYPIQCLTSIAQASVTAVRLEYRRYEESCSYRVYYDCPSEPMQRIPRCLNNRCEVALERNDRLMELTLEYLNK